MEDCCLQDIEAVDPEYFKNLAWMLENDITDILDLTFTEETDYFGKKELVELKSGGAAIKCAQKLLHHNARVASLFICLCVRARLLSALQRLSSGLR